MQDLGLGRDAAIELAKRGHTVIATVHFDNQINELNILSKKNNLNLIVFKLDILLKEDRDKINEYNVDVLICNAAIGDSGSICEISVDRIENVFETNVFSNIKLVQIVIRNMIEIKNNGRVIFLSSLAGRVSIPWLSPYCATKFAIEAFASCLRKELKLLKYANIQVGIIEPGAYATGFNKKNNDKKYTWMKDKSYFKNYLNIIHLKEKYFWNFLELKKYDSIIHQYIKAVEDTQVKLRYTAPKWQAFGIWLQRVLNK